MHTRLLAVLAATSPFAALPAQRILFEHHGPAASRYGTSVRDAGDVDGDGTRDVAVTQPSDPSPYVALVSGRTGAVMRTIPLPTGAGAVEIEAIGLGDVNGDGRSDVAVMTHARLTVHSGANGVLLFTTTPTTGSFSAIAPVGDWDGDGRADVALARYDNGWANTTVLRGSNGLELAVAPLVAAGSSGSMVAVGDFTGDGRSEVALVTDGSTIRVLNFFTPASVVRSFTFALSDGAQNLAAVDLDGDGRKELVVARPSEITSNGNRGVVRAYDVANGLERFVLQLPYDREGLGRAVASIGDLDADGAGDLVVGVGSALGTVIAVSSRTRATLWELDGSQQYSGCGASLAPLGDIDGDGFHDFAAGCPYSLPIAGGVQIVSGKVLARVDVLGGGCGGGPFPLQLGATRPVLGQSLAVVGRDGPANTPGALVVSLPPAFPTYLGAGTCTAHFDFATAAILGALTAPNWSLQLPIPAAPQLAGLGIVLQCFYAPTAGPLGFDLANGLGLRLGF